jgi:WhiB family redox-sensing transcriptional regulator
MTIHFVPAAANEHWTEPASPVPAPPEWRQHGACRGIDPDLFYPERGESLEAAKQICAACPVRGECLDFALDLNEKFGVWGGKSERERRKLRRRQHGPTGASDERRRQVRTMHAGGVPVTDIARELGVSTRTIHRYLQPQEEAS